MARANQIRSGTGRVGSRTSSRERRIVQEKLQGEFPQKPHREALGMTASSSYSQADLQAIIDRLDEFLEDDMKAGLRQRRRR